MELRTERLLLRPFTPDDLTALHSWHSDPEVVRYLFWDVLDLDGARDLLERRLGRVTVPEADGESIHFAVRYGTEVIGDVHLELLSAEQRCAEIGYVFGGAQAGRGFAGEAARELLRFGFDDLALHRIVGKCAAEHRASQAVLRKIGMRQEAHFVEALWVKDAWVSEQEWAILEHEWRG
ncbi:GNAT family N-acetyltransferase [Sciscionella marina]|uniref:GNAT family N-acetyltransferase n=1 Tax=Sciscionella marina TaxID=508770 RepID=UPI000377B1A0|nr:GNAT family N-acetyltransferase [Sciscionella marina]